MRTTTIFLSERDFLFAVGGQLFDQAPNRQPRNAEKIMEQARDAFRMQAYKDGDFYSIRVEGDLEKFVKTILRGIGDFEDLNLSQNEFEKGVKVGDEKRPPYMFTDRYSSVPWRNDFIDLDAFTRNVANKIHMLKDMSEDCFCCVHVKTDTCKTCLVNPEFKNKYEARREPRGKYTFACRYDCFESKYICCEECEKENCHKRCDASSETCGNRVK